MKTTQKTETAQRAFFKKRDIILIAIVLALAAVGFGLFRVFAAQGGFARVTILKDGKEIVRQYPLDTNCIIHIDDGELPVTLEVKNRRIRFVHSLCPDHLCEGFGWLSRDGEDAICLPARVWVVVISPASASTEPTKPEVDA